MYRKKRITGIERCVFAVESAILMREFAYEKCGGGALSGTSVEMRATQSDPGRVRPTYGYT